MLDFKQKEVIPFLKGDKLPMFCHKYFEKICFSCVLGWKTGGVHNIETFDKDKSGVVKKNLEHENFIAAALHRVLWY